MLTWDEIQSNAVEFSKRWRDAYNEEAQAQSFETALLKVFGVDDPERVGDFEYKVPLGSGHNGYIDYLWKGKIAIEFKSRGKDLEAAYRQLQNYLQHLPEEDIPDLQMVCDFENISLYRRSTKENWQFKTKELRKNIKRFADIAGYETQRVTENQVEVNVKAAERMAKLHDALKEHGYEGHVLEVYLVRLLFCLFADDTGIFPQDAFTAYIENSKRDGSDLSMRIAALFEVLNMPPDTRAKRTLLSDELKQFRYINGGLFADILPIAEFNEKMRETLLNCCQFQWSKISPAIFGAMFQGVMDKTQRRELGAHYTSEENILKLINPLFLDELWAEFDRVKTDPIGLARFHDKIASLKFLDPACGCGNFLIITYRELRRLELEILKMQRGSKQMVLDISHLLKVNVAQFYGIEYEDFPCQIAQVGMWLTDHLMNLAVQDEFGQYVVNLPLTQSATIVHGNALRINWEDIVPKNELSYILGNPPFVGYAYQSKEQKEDIAALCQNRNIDYVAAWYYKAIPIMQGTSICTAFVSTNSITQGEQVSAVWKYLFQEYNIHINFAYRTFKWSNEAKGKAAVHCVIIGFSYIDKSPKTIYEVDGTSITAQNINAYLTNAPDVFIDNRMRPICDVPEMQKGSIPVDDGNLIIEEAEYESFIKKEPKSISYIREFLGSDEFINGRKRYCLWLIDASPSELRQMPEVIRRIEACKEYRLKSPKEATRKFAEFPSRFMEIRQPETNYLAVPEVSSERRKYIPIGYLSSSVIVSNKIFTVADAGMYHFGILTSNVHMAWMRAVCGRLEMRYSYSNKIVYNNFPWPSPTNEQKAAIEAAAQGVLDARALFPDSSLADLYDPLSMPPELLKAHRALDKAVWAAYGFSPKEITSEAECVARLMEMWQQLANQQ